MSRLNLQSVDLDLESDVEIVSVPTYSEQELAYDCMLKRELPILLNSNEYQGLFCEEVEEFVGKDDRYYNSDDNTPSPIWRKKKNALNRWLERIFK